MNEIEIKSNEKKFMLLFDNDTYCNVYKSYLDAKKMIDKNFNEMYEENDGEDCDFQSYYSEHTIVEILKQEICDKLTHKRYLIKLPWVSKEKWYMINGNYRIYEE